MKRLVVGVLAMVVLVVAGTGRAESITDDFNDGVLDPAWQVVTQNAGASWLETGGTLNVGGSSGQTGELVIRYNQPLADMGSARIDYNWTSASGYKARVGLGLFDSSLVSFENDFKNGIWLKGIWSGSGDHGVDGRVVGGAYHAFSGVPTAGSFMIERNGNDFWVRYLDDGNWQDLFVAQHDFAGVPIYPYLFTSNSDTNPSWEVALDNFNADVVPEPSTLALLTTAALGFLGIARRKRKRVG